MRDWRVYVLTDSRAARGRSHREIAEAAIRGGATAVQLRMKDEPARRIVEAARQIAPLCRAAGVTFIVNDRADVAMIAGADGVHVGQDDLPAGTVRVLAGRDTVIGVSAATAGEAVAAERAGADYLGVGAVFATATKADAGPPVGLDRLREIRLAVRLPVVGIGGITADNAAAVIRAGAAGVAVITAVTLADDMAAAVRRIRSEVDAALPR
ncbi:MAG: thiamine phosphate synthase [Bacillati bacterium ANGP1]|uniref:Thiamine-phosphate synthase n=1 Tax=Candidatus Segetimicrobium genomatis TaxID=2569760 RepID=A0A537J7U8_9BACT|nr:MAG: thiamine phosphate synthase [Terrabacteria group bacterium ANGP1]